MGVSQVRFDPRTIVAFLLIYVVWGSTFLAIRIAVEQVPPLFAAGMRFALAGGMLYGWSRFRRNAAPTLIQWRNILLLAALMFVLTYSALFWAETRIPSGLASVLVATLPIWTILLETVVLRKLRLSLSLCGAVVLGFAGVVIIMAGSGATGVGLLPCFAVLGGELAWALGSVLATSVDLPKSNTITSGAEMLCGGMLLLAWAGLRGELIPFPRMNVQAALAILYLVIAGSLVAYTAFVWLLGRMPATRVASHAYVNPIVALAVGYWMGGEVLTTRIAIGTAIVLTSVFLIFRARWIVRGERPVSLTRSAAQPPDPPLEPAAQGTSTPERQQQ